MLAQRGDKNQMKGCVNNVDAHNNNEIVAYTFLNGCEKNSLVSDKQFCTQCGAIRMDSPDCLLLFLSISVFYF